MSTKHVRVRTTPNGDGPSTLGWSGFFFGTAIVTASLGAFGMASTGGTDLLRAIFFVSLVAGIVRLLRDVSDETA